MREIRLSGSEGGGTGTTRPFLHLSNWGGVDGYCRLNDDPGPYWCGLLGSVRLNQFPQLS